jgi:hypothetical protein
VIGRILKGYDLGIFLEVSNFAELGDLILRFKDADPPGRCPMARLNESSFPRTDGSLNNVSVGCVNPSRRSVLKSVSGSNSTEKDSDRLAVAQRLRANRAVRDEDLKAGSDIMRMPRSRLNRTSTCSDRTWSRRHVRDGNSTTIRL